MKKAIILSTILSLIFVSLFSLSLYSQKNEVPIPEIKIQKKYQVSGMHWVGIGQFWKRSYGRVQIKLNGNMVNMNEFYLKINDHKARSSANKLQTKMDVWSESEKNLIYRIYTKEQFSNKKNNPKPIITARGQVPEAVVLNIRHGQTINLTGKKSFTISWSGTRDAVSLWIHKCSGGTCGGPGTRAFLKRNISGKEIQIPGNNFMNNTEYLLTFEQRDRNSFTFSGQCTSNSSLDSVLHQEFKIKIIKKGVHINSIR